MPRSPRSRVASAEGLGACRRGVSNDARRATRCWDLTVTYGAFSKVKDTPHDFARIDDIDALQPAFGIPWPPSPRSTKIMSTTIQPITGSFQRRRRRAT